LATDGSALARRYSAYLFDLDGTLVDSAPDINGALNAALAAGGYPSVAESLTRHWVGFGSRVLLEHALTHHHAADRITDATHTQHLLSVFIEHYGAHIADASRVYPGVVAALTDLKARGAGLAIVTNKLTGLSVALLEALNLAHFFAAVVGGDTLPLRKPDAAPARHACRLLGCTPMDSLFVGDSTTDVETARAAGCPVVCVRGGYNRGTPAEQFGADAVIDSLIELL
jgi:phosphoglycolate phosphatase